jgi:SAM-dependent methyltransferase
MDCRICLEPTKGSYILHSSSYNLDVQMFYCPACEAYFSDGAPVNYEHIDDFDLIAYYLQYEHVIRNRYQKVFSFIESLVASGQFLDIGAGMGFSLDVASQRGWMASGLEPNPELAAHAKGRGLNVSNAYLTEGMSGEYDFILIDNVLEHILQPSDFLRNSVRLLKPSGVMMIAVPPMDWLRKGFSACSWVRSHVAVPQINVFYDVDQHVNIFSRKAMERLLQSVGLRLLDARFHHSLAYNNALFRGLRLDDGYYFAVRA